MNETDEAKRNVAELHRRMMLKGATFWNRWVLTGLLERWGPDYKIGLDSFIASQNQTIDPEYLTEIHNRLGCLEALSNEERCSLDIEDEEILYGINKPITVQDAHFQDGCLDGFILLGGATLFNCTFGAHFKISDFICTSKIMLRGCKFEASPTIRPGCYIRLLFFKYCIVDGGGAKILESKFDELGIYSTEVRSIDLVECNIKENFELSWDNDYIAKMNDHESTTFRVNKQSTTLRVRGGSIGAKMRLHHDNLHSVSLSNGIIDKIHCSGSFISSIFTIDNCEFGNEAGFGPSSIARCTIGKEFRLKKTSFKSGVSFAFSEFIGDVVVYDVEFSILCDFTSQSLLRILI